MLINPLRLFLQPETIDSTHKITGRLVSETETVNSSIWCKCNFTKEQHTNFYISDTVVSLDNPFMINIEKSDFAPEKYWEQFEDIRSHGYIPIGDLSWCPPYKDDFGRVQGNSFEATLYLNEYAYNPLEERLSQGAAPNEIHLGVDGIYLEYGTVPDDIIWDYQRERYLSILECEMIYHHMKKT